MLKAQNPVAGIQKIRKPLQPIKNSSTNIQIHGCAKPILKPSENEWTENKENHPIYVTPTKEMGLADASLAEELRAIRKKLERMRLDKEKTEKMLKEKELALGWWMKELGQRGQAQKMLENEVDRLFRLKQLKFMRVSLIRSLREEEEGKKSMGAQLKDLKAKDWEESIDESVLQSPISKSSEVMTDE